MGETFIDRFKHAWNMFDEDDARTKKSFYDYGISYGTRPDRSKLRLGNERSIIAAIYTRIAIDVSSISIQHVRLDENDRYLETIKSGLNECLTTSANIDQTGRALIQDIVLSMFDEGCVAVVPTEATYNPNKTGSYDINALRTGRILEWMPRHVRVEVYNDKTGKKEEFVLPKKIVAIVENPLYMVMNEPNSTLKRLINKLNCLDAIDQQSSSGKLDLIIQLPYVIKSDAKKTQAENRRLAIEQQLTGSKYGIAYTDGTERITQLNRPAENNLMAQIEYLTRLLYNQLGLTESIFDGTADEKTILNYYNRTVDPIVSGVVDPMKRTFITKTARTQGQSISYFRDPFKLVPVSELANIADKFTRNEILTPNDIRSVINFKPSSDPKADELRNRNITAPTEEPEQDQQEVDKKKDNQIEEDIQNGSQD